MIHSYPSLYAIGHRAIANLFDGPVVVEEKVDGSQFSMQRDSDGVLHCRSKGKELLIDAPEKMFTRAVEVAASLPLVPNWVYRCEYLSKPKHNTLAYERTPVNNLVVFDVMVGEETYLLPQDKHNACNMLGLEYVPMLFYGNVTSMEQLSGFLERDSFLGGVKVEGFVVKNYAQFTAEKKIAIGKYVSEDFKEVHQSDWKERNPRRQDVVECIINSYTTEASWRKAVQHLRDDGQLEGSPRDIGALIRAVPADILKEDETVIKDALFKHFWPQISRAVTTGLPDWYKQQLAQTAFEPTESVA